MSNRSKAVNKSGLEVTWPNFVCPTVEISDTMRDKRLHSYPISYSFRAHYYTNVLFKDSSFIVRKIYEAKNSTHWLETKHLYDKKFKELIEKEIEIKEKQWKNETESKRIMGTD